MEAKMDNEQSIDNKQSLKLPEVSIKPSFSFQMGGKTYVIDLVSLLVGLMIGVIVGKLL